jgi:transcriptional regulator with XRE-family HTH domain
MKKWKLSQENFGELLGTNRGVISSYLRETKASKPSVDFMIRLEKLCGVKISIKQLWENSFKYEDIPIQPVLEEIDPSTTRNNKSGEDLKNAFTVIYRKLEELEGEIKSLKGE